MKKQSTAQGIIRLKSEMGFIERFDSEEDVYIPLENLNQAMNGDTVEFSLHSRHGRSYGIIEKIVKRKLKEVTGILDMRRREWVLITRQSTYPIKLIIDSSQFKEKRISPGYYAAAEIIEYPDRYTGGLAKLKRVIGEAGNPDIEIKALNSLWDISANFPDEVIKEANRIPRYVSERDIEKRWDFRKLDVFTIDPVDARDFDDAVSLEVNTESGFPYRIGIHISDVSHYVKTNSLLDNEAFKRGTSIYLPGEVIPMLPEHLSNGVCSLVEGEDRLTFSVLAELDQNLRPLQFKLGKSVIRSKRRFTYEEVDEILDTGKGDFASSLLILKQFAERRAAERIKRGAIDLDLPEDKPILDADGKVVSVIQIPRTWSHRLIEELMLLANEYTANKMKSYGIFRIHEEPAAEKVIEFRRLSSLLGFHSRGDLNSILKHFRGQPCQKLIELKLLRTFQEAKYSAENKGHFGLALDAYTHFTSPIRRYPDLIVHRILSGEKIKSLNNVARHSSLKERDAMEAEREALQIRLIEYASTMIGDEAAGFIDGIVRDGIFVQLAIGPRGFISVDNLGRERFYYDKKNLSLNGTRTGIKFRLGMPIKTVISSVDITNRKLYLLLEDEAQRAKTLRVKTLRVKGKSKKGKRR